MLACCRVSVQYSVHACIAAAASESVTSTCISSSFACFCLLTYLLTVCTFNCYLDLVCRIRAFAYCGCEVFGYVGPRSGCRNYFSGCRMLRKLIDRCRTSLAAVSGIKTAVARDAELLLSNVAPPIRVGDYFACGTFLLDWRGR